MKKFIIIIISAVIISACNYRIARHMWELEPPLDIKLKLNGYYYRTINSKTNELYPAILYSDGTIFFSNGNYFSTYSFENWIKNYDSIYLYKSTDWGRYTIKDDTIIIRHLELCGGGIGGPNVDLIVLKGIIVNDKILY